MGLTTIQFSLVSCKLLDSKASSFSSVLWRLSYFIDVSGDGSWSRRCCLHWVRVVSVLKDEEVLRMQRNEGSLLTSDKLMPLRCSRLIFFLRAVSYWAVKDATLLLQGHISHSWLDTNWQITFLATAGCDSVFTETRVCILFDIESFLCHQWWPNVTYGHALYCPWANVQHNFLKTWI